MSENIEIPSNPEFLVKIVMPTELARFQLRYKGAGEVSATNPIYPRLIGPVEGKLLTMGVNTCVSCAAVYKDEKGWLSHSSTGVLMQDVEEFIRRVEPYSDGLRLFISGAAPSYPNDRSDVYWSGVIDRFNAFIGLHPSVVLNKYKIQKENLALTIGVNPKEIDVRKKIEVVAI